MRVWNTRNFDAGGSALRNKPAKNNGHRTKGKEGTRRVKKKKESKTKNSGCNNHNHNIINISSSNNNNKSNGNWSHHRNSTTATAWGQACNWTIRFILKGFEHKGTQRGMHYPCILWFTVFLTIFVSLGVSSDGGGGGARVTTPTSVDSLIEHEMVLSFNRFEITIKII